MQCQQCQTPLEAGAEICHVCGAYIPPTKSPAAQSPPRQVSEPAYRPQPPAGKKASQTIFMDFNQAPREILRVMDEAQQNAAAFNQQRKRWGRIFWLLLLAGIPFFCGDFALGYNIFTFTLVAITLWAAAIVGFIIRRRQGQPPKFGSQFDVTRSIFETIKDDVSPQKTLIGWLDLTGPEQESKATRQKNSQSGQPIVYYRDEWLRLKAGLFDGNILRMSLTDRVKVRQGYWKRSRISGKNKWKSGSNQSHYQLQFSVSVNTDLYQVRPFQSGSRAPNSRFVITQADAADGRLSIKAETDKTFDAWDVLNVMRFGYDHLHQIGT